MRTLIVVGFVLGQVAAVQAQQVTVQQPVVSTNSVRTSVSVPDRGSALLGGVSSAQSARSSYGPLRSGSSIGLSRSASSMSTSVYIHDLHAMDEALLNSVPDAPVPSAIRGESRRQPVDAARAEVASPIEKAMKFERLAKQAEAAGKSGVAKLHWQIAAKYGSKLAAEKLMPGAKRIELFSRTTRNGWASWGDQAGTLTA